MPSKRTNTELKTFIEESKLIDANGCWLWTGSKSAKGYGVVNWNNKLTLVHRTYWLLCGKTIPTSLEMCHGPLCVGKKHCFNPDHLTPDTQSKNQLDRFRDGMATKITPAQVLEIRASTEMTRQELANKYHVSSGYISNIINKRKWKHI